MKIIEVTEKNISFFKGYQGNNQKLKAGDFLYLEKEKVSAVFKPIGKSGSFSIFQGDLKNPLKNGDREKHYWYYNRFSINLSDYKKSDLN